MLTFLIVLSGIAALGSIVWALVTEFRFASLLENKKYDKEALQKIKRPRQSVPTALAILGFFVFFWLLSGSAEVPATHIAVLENTWTGQFYVLGPGTHIWPFSPARVPFATKVTKYDLRRQVIEIGAQPVLQNGVQADSNSPGRPVVYFWARGWAYPNKDRIIELHRKYGPMYLDDWIERVWVSSLKGLQGERPYDYVGNYRAKMQDEVEKQLQSQLLGEDNEPLVYVSQLAIVNFDFEEAINNYLKAVSQKEFERQQAEQQILINSKTQEAAKIDADTSYITTKRAAEAEQAKRIAEAEGQAQAVKLVAEAEAYSIKVKYEAEANGVRLVQEALAASPAAYLEYQRTQKWNGQLPTYMLGDTTLPFLNVPSGK